MKKALLGIMTATVLVSGFWTQCSREVQAADDVRVIQFAYTSLPGSDTDLGCNAMADKLAELSGGTFTMDLYPGGELYTQDGQATALRRGTLDISLFGMEWLAGLCPELGCLCSAYSIADLDHLNEIFNEDNEVNQYIYDIVVNELNIIPLCTWYFGNRTLNLRNGQDVTIPDDMKNVKLRMSDSAGFIAMGKALGAIPTPMNLSEVYMALQNGTVDGQDNPLSTMINRKFYEVTDTVILTNHYVSPITIYCAKDTWESLTEEQQGWLMEAAEEGMRVNNEAIEKSEAEAVEFLKNEGLTVNEVDVDVWKEFAYEYYETDPISQEWDMEFFDKVKALAE